jgi:hypothetical protein
MPPDSSEVEGSRTSPARSGKSAKPSSQGKPITVKATLWFQIGDERIERVRHHLDILGMSEQLEVLPG